MFTDVYQGISATVSVSCTQYEAEQVPPSPPPGRGHVSVRQRRHGNSRTGPSSDPGRLFPLDPARLSLSGCSYVDGSLPTHFLVGADRLCLPGPVVNILPFLPPLQKRPGSP